MLSSPVDPFELKPDYWKRKLHAIPPMQIPADYARPVLQYYKGDSVSFCIDKNLSEQLRLLCYQQDVSVYTALLAAFKVLLYRHGNMEDIGVVSLIPVAQANKKGEAIDFLVRKLALYSKLGGNTSFSAFLQQVKNAVTEAINQSNTPEIEERNKQLLQAMFILQDDSGKPAFDPGFIKIFKEDGAKPDLILIMAETEAGFQGTVSYRPEAYQKENIGQIINHYNELLDSIVKDPTQKIGALGMLTKAEEDTLLTDFNNTLASYPKNKTIVDIFQEQVLSCPDGIALRQGNQSMSYDQLNQQSNRLANYLIKRGVVKGDNIGLLVARGFDMVTGMYAIMKAGAAYVPIDPDYPLDRQQYILKQSTVKLTVADDQYPIKNLVAVENFIDISFVDLSEFSSENVSINTDSTQLAYTIYTSGSTGRPKGVMIEHHSVVNLIFWVNTRFNVSPEDRLLFITSMCFDLSVYDIFGMLSAGGTVVIARTEEVQDVRALQEMLHEHAITFWDSVPTTMDYLVRELETSGRPYIQNSLKTVFLSGDWIPVNLPERIKKYFPFASVISLGGATEGTVWSNFFPVEKTNSNWYSIPYGKPLQNNFFYILNEQLQPVPQGVVGELFIGGVGVARGYANEPDKTKDSFVEDPFNRNAGGMMYRTGDLGRMLPDMNMEFIGRKDNQVKIRGFRVELGEIESMLNQSGLVRQAVVLAKNNREGKKRLIGYVVTNASFHRNAVINHLKSKLPEYMIPAAWVQLETMPLTPNGKIDRNALPDAEMPEQKNEHHALPGNHLERTFARIWQQVLGVEKIGIRDNFFELGGHSLIGVQIITKVENETGNKLPLAIFFKYPTIEQQVASIEKNMTSSIWKSLVPIKATGNKPPLYIVHGDGLNVLNFGDLAKYVDEEQPVFGLQARGLDGIEKPLDDITEIAKHYISEILEHNPSGPYAIGGYSFGGYVAIEMRKQLEVLGKEVKMLAIFDTNAINAIYNKNLSEKIFKKITRQVPKFFWFTKLFFQHPRTIAKYQLTYLQRQFYKMGLMKKPVSTGMYAQFEKINEKHQVAFKKYRLAPFNDRLHLFKSKIHIYFIDDQKYLGWANYAKKGVQVYDVPGDHKTMFEQPHVKEFAGILQSALDNIESEKLQ